MTTRDAAPSDDLPHLRTQVAVIGGGIAGLWTACRLQALGYATCLIEQHALGSDQTLASQGILHGGVKYAVSPAASSAAAAIAGMPSIWKACLQGQGEVDLRKASITSEAQWMWTAGSTLAGLTALVASKVIRTSVRTVPASDACPGLHAAPASRAIYRVEEPILDIASVVSSLRDEYIKQGGMLIHAQAKRDQQGRCTLNLATGSSIALHAQALVFTAGQGNEHLSPQVNSQQRPLQMVMIKRAGLPAIFGHCIAPLSDKPRLTITTHRASIGSNPARADGETIWYVGGQIAEHGATQTPQEVMLAARREVAECLPWIDLSGASMATCWWIRAEGLTPDGKRPDEPVVHVQQGADPAGPACVITAWPTKLVFAPLVSQRIIEQLAHCKITPESGDYRAKQAPLPSPLPMPPVAPLPWDRPELLWS